MLGVAHHAPEVDTARADFHLNQGVIFPKAQPGVLLYGRVGGTIQAHRLEVCMPDYGIKPTAANSRAATWHHMVDEFSAQMFSLIHISETLIPEMEKREGNAISGSLNKYGNLLKGEDLAEFRKAVEWFGGSLGEITGMANRGERDGVDAGVLKDAAGITNPSFQFVSANAATAFGNMLHESLLDVQAGPREETLRKSLLVSAVSSFEILFGRLAEQVYKVNKSALNDADFAFSLQQMAEFDSLEDAREFLAERKISTLMRDSVDGWSKWLGKAVKGVSMEGLPIDWPNTREVFARRNLIVHNGGVVNRIYLGVVRDLGVTPSGLKVGDKLKVDALYFAQGVQSILALGVLLAVDVSAKLHKDKDYVRELQSLVFRTADVSVRRKSWIAAVALSGYLLGSRLNRSSELRAQLLNWTARKGAYGAEAIQGEVAEWDISGLSDQFAHCKKVLIGEKSSAIEAVEKLIIRGKLTIVEVMTNPIYADLVSDIPSLVIRSQGDENSRDQSDEADET